MWFLFFFWEAFTESSVKEMNFKKVLYQKAHDIDTKAIH
jgi:hypothetical protein